MYLRAPLLAVIGAAIAAGADNSTSSSDDGPQDTACRANCSGDECVFTARLNLFAGELGYYTFEECGDEVNPTLGMEVGKTYRFDQSDVSNFYHPLGFAYYPDGAHADVDELEPGIAPPGSASKCADDMTCPAPMYFQAGTYLGEYSNDANVAPVTTGADNFGLDDYEPKFFHPLGQWTEYGDFSITLKFDIDDFSDDIFYFCHIHQFMTGRIKLLDTDDFTLSLVDTPKIDYAYDEPSLYDRACGTFGLGDFQLPNSQCPDKFVCNVPAGDPALSAFSDCIDSMDCAMMQGMTTGVSAGSIRALFMHQMIPHHQNAVNMAKALLNANQLNCPDILEETSDCTLEVIAREIINAQNGQIQSMQGYLDELGYDETDDCIVDMTDSSAGTTQSSPTTPRKKNLCAGGGACDVCRANCSGDECVFTAKLNLFAGELGYYTFEECGDEVNPTLGMEVGKTYRFDQSDVSNFYHPLGFAYYPDGAHADVDELEPGIAPPGSASKCADDMTCPAPMYFQAGTYLGEYSNDANVAPVTTGADNFGLDDYEPKFFHPLGQWTEYGDFSITLKFDFDTKDFKDDIFYFCHIHQFMTGRIKLLAPSGDMMQHKDTPPIPYSYDTPSQYDESCGTFGLGDFQLPNSQCPDKFVCNASGASAGLSAFSDCIDSMDCAMMQGMTTGVSAGSIRALFMHQMIPHHRNAVNMAKALLKTGAIVCADVLEETADCGLATIAREIINVQNGQIQSMVGILEAESYPATDDCTVEI